MTTPAAATAATPITISAQLVATCRVASPHDVVCKDECVYTFHTPSTTDQGIVVNLHTFMGTVVSLALNDTTTTTTSPPAQGIFLRIVQQYLPKPETIHNDHPPSSSSTGEVSKEKEPKAAAPTKLGIGMEGGFPSTKEEDAFELVSNYSVVVLETASLSGDVHVVSEWPFTNETKSSFPAAVVASVESILHHAGMSVQQDVQVWQLDQDPIPISKYAASLPFVENGVTIDPNPSSWKCQSSGATENLWLNLSDGYIGGGRKHWDGSGGSNGALDHYQETGQLYPLVVKLGTITADIETADCYSYAPDEDGPVRVPNLTDLLEKRGIKVASMYVVCVCAGLLF
jgi:ubiquitin carboxyl-terminal hydrolase 5/13